jgi:hypothetical protein
MTSAPGIFGHLANAICKIYKFKPIDELIKWVDNFVFFRYPSNLVAPYTYSYDASIIWDVAADLGWPWAPKKHTPFAYTFMYIGFNWDLPHKTVSLPDSKCSKYLTKLSTWTQGSGATKQDAEKLTGTLNHCTLIICKGCTYLTTLYTFIASFKPNSHHLVKHTISHKLAADLLWWRKHLSSPPCTLSIKPPPPPLASKIHVDASTSWGISFIMDNHWLAWHLLPSWHSDGRDIGWAEMVAVELALHSVIAAQYHSVHLIIRSDNQGVVGASHAGKSHNNASNLILCKITDLFLENDLWITITWIPTSHNLADGPSCGVFPSAQNLFWSAPRIPLHLSQFVAHLITYRDLSYLQNGPLTL